VNEGAEKLGDRSGKKNEQHYFREWNKKGQARVTREKELTAASYTERSAKKRRKEGYPVSLEEPGEKG